MSSISIFRTVLSVEFFFPLPPLSASPHHFCPAFASQTHSCPASAPQTHFKQLPSSLHSLPQKDLVLTRLMFTTLTVAGRPGEVGRDKPCKFQEAAERTGGFQEGNNDAVRFRCPGGVCEATDGTIYVCDAYNHVIRRRVGSVWSTLVGKPEEKGCLDGHGDGARFSYPQRILLDASGSIIVAGGGSHVLHQVTPSGEVSTLAGIAGQPGSTNGPGLSAQFNRPIGLAIDANTGDIYVGDVGNHCIRKVSKSGQVSTLAGKSKEKGFVDGVGEDARFNQPCGLSFNTENDGADKWLIIADCNNHCIRKLSLKDLSVITIAGKAGEAGHADGVGCDARFNNPSDVAVKGDGTVVVADNSNHCIRLLASSAPDARVSTISGTAGKDGFEDSLTSDAPVATSPAPPPSASPPASSSAATAASSASSLAPGRAAAFFHPNALSIGVNGSVLVVDTWNHSIRRIEACADSGMEACAYSALHATEPEVAGCEGNGEHVGPTTSSKKRTERDQDEEEKARKKDKV